MANPIGTEFALVKKLLAWSERATKQGLDIEADELQPSVDDPVMMRRLVRYIQAGAPEFRVARMAPVLPFEEPESHRKAREILGAQNFHGVAAVQQHFGVYTETELAARREIPFTEETLRECALEFVLLATHPLDLSGVHAAHPERFNDDPDDPWFARKEEREKWSSQTITAPWLLVRKKPLPDSWNKRIDAQKTHIERFPKERLIEPCENAYTGIVHYAESGEKLCDGYVIRFAVQAAGGRWVGVCWVGGRLFLGYWSDGAYDVVASGSVRAS
ncbi:MAG: hypothetical protein Greene041619_538 [Candidatus Peregrinibacteria bacterium Greene0416_19]|nr:MAG: hypothetical protein Greene041619_538 [Candidatus Peregrinibacteria bacterium Greene0416_19]